MSTDAKKTYTEKLRDPRWQKKLAARKAKLTDELAGALRALKQAQWDDDHEGERVADERCAVVLCAYDRFKAEEKKHE